MNTTQFMDKQIMDLSNSQSSQNNSNDFIDRMNPSEDHHHHNIGGDDDGGGSIKKEEIIPSYDFQPIRPTGSSSPPANVDAGHVSGGGPRAWLSADSRTNSSPIRNYGSLEAVEPAKVISGKDHNIIDAALLSEIDRTMKKHADNLLHSLEAVSARLSQLETRTCQLENSVDDLKLAVGNSHGNSDGKMRQLENLLREIQTSVQVVRDKQDIIGAQFEVAKLHVQKVEQQPEIRNTVNMDSVQQVASAPQQPPVSHPQLPVTVPPANAPSSPSQQNLPHHVQVPNQFAPNQLPSVSQQGSYFPQPPEIPSQAYQLQQAPPPQPQPQLMQPAPPPQPRPQQQYQASPQSQYSQPPPPPLQHPHHSLSALNPSQPQPPIGHHGEETPFVQSQNYPPGIHQPPSYPPTGAPHSQQFFGTSPNVYEGQPDSRGPGFSGAYGPTSVAGESYTYSSSPTRYGGGSQIKPQQPPTPVMSQTAGMGYPQLPTARILPEALPTASSVGGGPVSAGSGNRVPLDDVVDRVTNMGFPRDQVRATVRKLTESGQSVDLNSVLDKLMNDGEGQPLRGWFGR